MGETPSRCLSPTSPSCWTEIRRRISEGAADSPLFCSRRRRRHPGRGRRRASPKSRAWPSAEEKQSESVREVWRAFDKSTSHFHSYKNPSVHAERLSAKNWAENSTFSPQFTAPSKNADKKMMLSWTFQMTGRREKQGGLETLSHGSSSYHTNQWFSTGAVSEPRTES